jgi:tetratricopeptide (TPR) repeat protein
MLGFAWLTLRQAQEALKNGRLEEAQRLLAQPSAQGHRRAGDLQVRLGRAFAERGERQLQLDDAEGAWRDLLQAERLGAADKVCDRLRQALTRLGIAEVRALLQAGETGRADETVSRLRQRGVRSAELPILEEGLRGWQHARSLADRGEFPAALEAVERARRVFGANQRLEEYQADLRRRRERFAELLGKLHGAAAANHWREVIEAAEQVLAAAPQHAEARTLRTQAWKAVQPATVALGPPAQDVERNGDEAQAGSPRYVVWIDGVGGFLICLGNRLTFGQAALDSRADIPLVADVSRLHATLTRDGEGYLVEAVRPIQINAQTVTRALLHSGDRLTLGTTCQFLFRQPVPGNMTARLDLVSGHRFAQAVDAVVVLAETVVLAGGATNAHVGVPDLKRPIVLYRHKDGLGVHHEGELRVDGKKCVGRTFLGPRANVTGEDIAFAVEPAE